MFLGIKENLERSLRRKDTLIEKLRGMHDTFIETNGDQEAVKKMCLESYGWNNDALNKTYNSIYQMSQVHDPWRRPYLAFPFLCLHIVYMLRASFCVNTVLCRCTFVSAFVRYDCLCFLL